VTEEELGRIRRDAQRSGRSLSSFLRYRALNPVPVTEAAALAALRALGRADEALSTLLERTEERAATASPDTPRHGPASEDVDARVAEARRALRHATGLLLGSALGDGAGAADANDESHTDVGNPDISHATPELAAGVAEEYDVTDAVPGRTAKVESDSLKPDARSEGTW
jgi:hypothetical protein